MQNNFTVENLVTKYRNYVNEHCPKSCEFDGVKEFETPLPPYGSADEQLLVTMYSKVAGNNADKVILKTLAKYAEKYYTEALSEAEVSYLCDHFEKSVSVIFSHLKEYVGNFGNFASEQAISIIKENAINKEGATVFIAHNNNGDMAELFPKCKIKGFVSEEFDSDELEMWALVQIRLFARGIKSDITVSSKECYNESYLQW